MPEKDPVTGKFISSSGLGPSKQYESVQKEQVKTTPRKKKGLGPSFMEYKK